MVPDSPLSPQTLSIAKRALLIPPFPEFVNGEKVRLEPLCPQRHAPALFKASNGTGPHGEPNAYDAEALIWRFMFGGPYENFEDFSMYLNALAVVEDGLAICILDQESGVPIGLANYCANKPTNLCIELGGIWYSPPAQRTGANTETIRTLLRHAFDTLGYRRVEWKCDRLNTRSRKAALRLGFKYEGIFRQHMIIKGRNRDTAWFAMTDSDWKQIRD